MISPRSCQNIVSNTTLYYDRLPQGASTRQRRETGVVNALSELEIEGQQQDVNADGSVYRRFNGAPLL
jgi:hypothetical protein